MPPFPGHMRAPAISRSWAVYALLQHYNNYEPFQASASALGEIWRMRLAEAGRDTLAPWYWRQHLVIPFAQIWNLHGIPEAREFSYQIVSDAIQLVGTEIGGRTCKPFDFLGFSQMEPEDPAVTYDGKTWSWALGNGETLANFRDRVAADLDSYRAADLPISLREQLARMPAEADRLGWDLTDAKHAGKRHVRWLFLRLCPQPHHPWSAQQIAAAETAAGAFTHERTVQDATRTLADFTDVTLPLLPPGRPRKAAVPRN